LVAGWLVIGAAGLLAPRSIRYIAHSLFPLSAVIALAMAVVAIGAMGQAPEYVVLPLGLPDLPFHLRLDALSAMFLALLGASSAGISIYTAGYLRPGEGTAPGLQCLQ